MINLESISISNIAGIKHLNLNFNKGFNLICGPNGVGKTTILECIGHSFSSGLSNILRKNSNAELGSWSVNVNVNDVKVSRQFDRRFYHPFEMGESGPSLWEQSNEVIVFKTHRDLYYMSISSINRDPVFDIYQCSNTASSGVSATDVKSWFINRYLWSSVVNSLSDIQIANLEIAKKCFEFVDPDLKFHNVQADTYDIILNTPKGPLYFEYLSSGYKSILYILLGLIKEIEFRFKNPSLRIDQFNGLILLDEIDLHLHPQWQAGLISSLKRLVPNAQIIASTHSPSMIQVAAPNEIIALGFDEENQVCLRDIPQSEFGFQGWTIEEILTDVMGLELTRSTQYISAIKQFEDALDNDNYECAKAAIEVLEKMLHPKNPTLKILKLQIASLGGPSND